MRGKWYLSEEELKNWAPRVEADIKELLRTGDDDIDYTETDLNPFQLGEIVESLGWEENEVDRNGWEQDRWAYYSHPDYEDRICIFSCGMTFKLSLGACIND